MYSVRQGKKCKTWVNCIMKFTRRNVGHVVGHVGHVGRRLALDSVSWSVFLVCREDRAACVREASSCLTHLDKTAWPVRRKLTQDWQIYSLSTSVNR